MVNNMHCFAITNQKGGCGKTTTAVNLAAALGEAKKRVLLIDLDPQASASSWLGVKDGGQGLYDVLVENAPLAQHVRPSTAPGVDLVPSSSALIRAEKALAGEVGSEGVFRRALSQLPDKWDYVLLDCPQMGLLPVSALVAANEVLVPVEASAMALAGVLSLSETVKRIRERLNPEVAISGILPCRVDARTNLCKEVIECLRGRFGGLVFSTVIRENIRLAEAPSHGKPITLYDTRSAGAEDHRALARELLARKRRRH